MDHPLRTNVSVCYKAAVSPNDILFIVSCSMNGESFRLTNGSTNREDRVEVCVDGRWGTVCNNSQEGIAGAVCSQLGWAAAGKHTSRQLTICLVTAAHNEQRCHDGYWTTSN